MADKDYLVFYEGITAFASKLPTPITLRPEQLAVMFLLLTTNAHSVLIQLETGLGNHLCWR